MSHGTVDKAGQEGRTDRERQRQRQRQTDRQSQRETETERDPDCVSILESHGVNEFVLFY